MKRYTCNDYRQEMILVGLKKRLAAPDLTEAEKKHLEEQIGRIQADMDLD